MTRLIPPVSARDHALGPANAPVTLVEYGDYECPYCGAVHPVTKALIQRFGRRLRFVFRHFPLTQAHPHAEHAAEAAEAAGAQGRFWEMHDMLFENQRALSDMDLLRYAAAVVVDPEIVSKALAEGTFRSRVREDFMSGVRSGVNGTPSFFLNGEKYEGAHDFPSLSEAIEVVMPAGRA